MEKEIWILNAKYSMDDQQVYRRTKESMAHYPTSGAHNAYELAK